MNPQGKTVVATGAGSAMGRELTAKLLRIGAEVAAVNVRPENLQETKNLGEKICQNAATFPL